MKSSPAGIEHSAESRGRLFGRFVRPDQHLFPATSLSWSRNTSAACYVCSREIWWNLLPRSGTMLCILLRDEIVLVRASFLIPRMVLLHSWWMLYNTECITDTEQFETVKFSSDKTCLKEVWSFFEFGLCWFQVSTLWSLFLLLLLCSGFLCECFVQVCGRSYFVLTLQRCVSSAFCDILWSAVPFQNSNGCRV